MENALIKLFLPVMAVAGLLSFTLDGYAAPVEYVKVCSLYGAAFHYIPGTDICLNDETGETRQQTPAGTWTSLLPTNNQGRWVTNPQQECGSGRLASLGTVRPSDFKINPSEKYQVAPVPLNLQHGEFISKVMLSGGFYDPLQPLAREPRLSPQQFCLRMADPNYFVIDMGSPAYYPYFCSTPPLGCVSNSQIVGTSAAYSFSVLGAPVVHYNTNSNGQVIGPAMTCGSQLVLTTGMGNYNPTVVSDPSQPGMPIPAAGTLSAWVCIEQGTQSRPVTTP